MKNDGSCTQQLSLLVQRSSLYFNAFKSFLGMKKSISTLSGEVTPSVSVTFSVGLVRALEKVTCVKSVLDPLIGSEKMKVKNPVFRSKTGNARNLGGVTSGSKLVTMRGVVTAAEGRLPLLAVTTPWSNTA